MSPCVASRRDLPVASQCDEVRRGATGCTHIASRRTNLAVISQFWKTVAQNQATTQPCLLSRGIRSTAVKMDEKLYLLIKFGPILRYNATPPGHPPSQINAKRDDHRRSVWVRAIFRRRCQQWEFHTSCKKYASNTSRLSTTDRETSVQLQRVSPHSPFYAAQLFIARLTGT